MLKLKSTICSLAVLALVAGCSSTKLDDSAANGAGAGGAGSGGAASGVAPVTIDPNAQTAAGPVGVARIVYFDYDSYTIKPEFQSLIDGHARFLKANAQRRISIEGHTDDVPIQSGRFGSNWELSLARALAVVRYLVSQGVPPERLSANGFGEYQPLDGTDTPEARRRNRRIELKLSQR